MKYQFTGKCKIYLTNFKETCYTDYLTKIKCSSLER